MNHNQGKQYIFLLIAVIMIMLIPLVPLMTQFRIKVLRRLKWRGLADFHGRHFGQIVMIVRTIIVTIIIFLTVLVFIV